MDKPDSVMMPILTPVKYPDGKGSLADCFELEIACHSRKQYKKTIYFKTVLTKISTLVSLPDSIMGRVIGSSSQEEKKEEVEDNSEHVMTPQQLSMAINLNAGEYNIDVEDMLDRFEKLAKGGVVLIEGKPITVMQIEEEIDPSDLEKAMYVYLANFLMPLVMKNLTDV